MDWSLPGSSVHGNLQARILEGVAISSSRDLPDSEIELASLTSPALAVGFFTSSATIHLGSRRLLTSTVLCVWGQVSGVNLSESSAY